MAATLDIEEGAQMNEEILIIDDDEINRAILDNLFSGMYATDEAENGRIGLEKILGNPEKFSAILLDAKMPEMDGLEVLRHMKEAGLNGKIPVFLITADASDSVMREAYRLEVMDVISKPIVPYVVLRRVNSVMELFRARKQLSSRVEIQSSELIEKEHRIADLNRGLFEALAAAIEFRNGESGEHVRRIHDITMLMLEKTDLGDGLSEEDMDNIALAAVMHDVGKIAIPDDILNKPGRLTKEEFEVIKTHTVRGEALLETIPQLRENKVFGYACDIARHHHERWDGRGYPDGLKGDEISVWAQIVSLADVYDALSSKRVYKDAYPREKVIAMITGGECGVFNPVLLDRFMKIEDELSRMYVPE